MEDKISNNLKFTAALLHNLMMFRFTTLHRATLQRHNGM